MGKHCAARRGKACRQLGRRLAGDAQRLRRAAHLRPRVCLRGKPSQEKFRKQITRLRIAREDEQQVVLTGRIRNERGKEDGLEITLDKNSKLIRTLKIRNEVTIDDQPGALELVMEFEPSPNVPVSEQTWSMPQK